MGLSIDDRAKTPLPNYPTTQLTDSLFDAPGFRDVELLEQANRVPIRHAGDEVAGGGVEALCLDRPQVQKLIGAFPHLFPQAAENARGLLELGRRNRVLVDCVEEEAA